MNNNYLTFGLYYDPEKYFWLLRDLLRPMLQYFETEGQILNAFYYCNDFRGNNIRVWLQLSSPELVDQLKGEVREWTADFFQRYPATRMDDGALKTRLFLRFQPNSLQFIAPNDLPYRFLNSRFQGAYLGNINRSLLNAYSELDQWTPEKAFETGLRLNLELFSVIGLQDTDDLISFLDILYGELWEFFDLLRDVEESMLKRLNDFSIDLELTDEWESFGPPSVFWSESLLNTVSNTTIANMELEEKLYLFLITSVALNRQIIGLGEQPQLLLVCWMHQYIKQERKAEAMPG